MRAAGILFVAATLLAFVGCKDEGPREAVAAKDPTPVGVAAVDPPATKPSHARFDGEGKLVDVPSCTPSEVEKLQANPKSNCPSYPVQVHDGLIWVWADNSADAALQSALTPLPRMMLPHETDETVDESRVQTLDWNWRELPYGHDFFIENVVDPGA